MEAGESNDNTRKRTESVSAGSESDLSDGWNFVEHLDTNQPDILSSDGESVEVIEPDNDISEQVLVEEQVMNGEEGVVVKEQENSGVQLVAQSAASVVPIAEADPPAIFVPDNLPRREEMFDTSFCWFLFFTVSAVIFSNIVFMAAESGFNWNMENFLDNTPSFLRDLPVTPKLPPQEKLVSTITWTDKEDAVVETVEDTSFLWQLANGIKQSVDDNQKNKQKNTDHKVKTDKLLLKIDNFNIGKCFQRLSDATDSVNAQNNLAQTLLILDALHIGLNDLEEVVTENSELKNALKLQKKQLHDVLKEIESGLSRAIDKIASNILFRVQKLESSFETQWCQLEKSGHKEELKGLFYECPDIDEYDDRKHKMDYKNSDKSKDANKYEDKNKKSRLSKDSDQYEVDKDGTGKYNSKSEGKWYNDNEHKKFVNIENPSYKKEATKTHNDKSKERDHNLGEQRRSVKENKETYLKGSEEIYSRSEQVKFNQQQSNSHVLEENLKHQTKTLNDNDEVLGNSFQETEKVRLHRYSHVKSEYPKNDDNDNRKSFDSTDSYQYNKHKSYKYGYEQQNDRKNNFKKPHYEQNYEDKSTVGKLSKYLKESCKKISEKAKLFNLYEKLKNSVEDKAKIPIDIFNSMFQKYCQPGKESFKENNYIKENLKGEFRRKSYQKKEFPKNAFMIKDTNSNIQNVYEFNIVETPNTREELEHPISGPKGDKIIEPLNKHRQWTFSYEEPSSGNKTKYDGDWFLKAGDSRSKSRWSQRRSDWLFDRASHRRHSPHYFSTFLEKRKNWFFRRAYARQQCRETPHGEWCNFHQDDKVTMPSSKFR